MREYRQLQEKRFDMEHNKKLLLFNKAYRVMGVIFCICLIAIMLVTVSYLPRTGNASNPDNNEVSGGILPRASGNRGGKHCYRHDPGLRGL